MKGFVSLMYHNVCAEQPVRGIWRGFDGLSPSITDYFVDRESFRRHCEIISEQARCLSIDALTSVDRISQPDRTAPIVHITFDDGWRGTIDEAGLILEERGLTATLFITTDLIGHPQFVSRQQIEGAGPTFAIGAHGRTHRLLATLSNKDIREELSAAKATLEDILGRNVDLLAFPGGSYTRRVLRIAWEAGYRWLFTSDVHVNRLPASGSLIGRVPIKGSTTPADLRRYVAADLRAERIRAAAIGSAKRLLGHGMYAAIRSRLLSEQSDHLEMTDLSRQPQRAEHP